MRITCQGMTGLDLADVVVQAIAKVNEAEYNGDMIIRTMKTNPRSFDFTIRMRHADAYGAAVTRKGHRSSYACWHAHRDLMMVMFGRHHSLKLVSGIIRYDGFGDFMESYAATGERNIGSMMEPVRAADACRCALGYYFQAERMRAVISEIIKGEQP